MVFSTANMQKTRKKEVCYHTISNSDYSLIRTDIIVVSLVILDKCKLFSISFFCLLQCQRRHPPCLNWFCLTVTGLHEGFLSLTISRPFYVPNKSNLHISHHLYQPAQAKGWKHYNLWLFNLFFSLCSLKQHLKCRGCMRKQVSFAI